MLKILVLLIVGQVSLSYSANETIPEWVQQAIAAAKCGMVVYCEPFKNAPRNQLYAFGKSQPTAIFKNIYPHEAVINPQNPPEKQKEHKQKIARENKNRMKSIFYQGLFYKTAVFLGFGDCVTENYVIPTNEIKQPSNAPENRRKICNIEKFVPLYDVTKEFPEGFKKLGSTMNKAMGKFQSFNMVPIFDFSGLWKKDRTAIIDRINITSLQKIAVLFMLLNPTDCTCRNLMLRMNKETKLLDVIMTDYGESFGFCHMYGPHKPNFLSLGKFAEQPIPKSIIDTLNKRTTKNLEYFIAEQKKNCDSEWLLSNEEEQLLYKCHRTLLNHIKQLAEIPLARFMFTHMHDHEERFKKVFEKKRHSDITSKNEPGWLDRDVFPASHHSIEYWRSEYYKSIEQS